MNKLYILLAILIAISLKVIEQRRAEKRVSVPVLRALRLKEF